VTKLCGRQLSEGRLTSSNGRRLIVRSRRQCARYELVKAVDDPIFFSKVGDVDPHLSARWSSWTQAAGSVSVLDTDAMVCVSIFPTKSMTLG